MRSKSVIFGVLCSLLVMSMVRADLVGDSVAGTDYHASKMVTFSAPPPPEIKAEVFVTISDKFFYKAWICNKDGKIQIKILNEKTKYFNLEFKR
jgi:hypothetical protein